MQAPTRMSTDYDTQLCKCLRDGGVVVMPTDTLYGVCACSAYPSAVDRVYQLKQRDPAKPCIILIDSIAALRSFGVVPTREQQSILAHVWPGPSSVVIETSAGSDCSYLHRGTDTLAFRLPDNLRLRQFIARSGPLIAPSANRAGESPARSVSEAYAAFGDEVDRYMDGGLCDGGVSRLVSVVGNECRVLRGSAL